MVSKFKQNNLTKRKLINALVIIISVLFCYLIAPLDLPGMSLLGVKPNWLLIWLVSWSVKRNVWDSLLAGIILGIIQDGMTFSTPSHIWSLSIIAVLTAKIKKQRYMEEDFVSAALIVFGMTLVNETVMAIQFSLVNRDLLADIWQNYQNIVLVSALISSLWTPVIYYPLNYWWKTLQKSKSIY
ncbi:MAG: rod shape-determining protein MreD [Cyanobacteria bacterium J083]|nr:MAG: rod shape-determining protein MreD [Cyanobacteria bacterium J083]